MEYEEGLIKVRVPSREKLSRKNEVFLNENKKFDRDLNVLLVKALNWKNKNYLGLMSASGIRGLRLKKETNAFKKIILNDKKKQAVKSVKKNLKLNGLKGEVYEEDAKKLLHKLNHGVDFVDVDPYGSPIYYVSDAVRVLSREGVLAITSTDTGALSGAYVKACRRRYGSNSYKSEFYYESGLRILAKSAIMECSKYDIALKPIFAHATRHYFRLYFKKVKGAKPADELVKKNDFISYCSDCLNREVGYFKKCSNCGSMNTIIGPLFTGSLYDTKLVKRMKSLGKYEEFFNKVLEEDEVNTPWFYTTSKIAQKYKLPEPSMKELSYHRTHINPKGFKTRQSIQEVVNEFESHH